jgi:hypothetical protein
LVAAHSSPALVAADGAVHRRSLADGREYTIIKIFRTRAELAAALRRAGIDAEVRETATFFQYATGTRRGSTPPPPA